MVSLILLAIWQMVTIAHKSHSIMPPSITWNVGPSVSTSDVSYVRVSASRDGGNLYNSEIMCVTVFGELS